MATPRANDEVEAAIRAMRQAVEHGRLIRTRIEDASGSRSREFLVGLGTELGLSYSAVLRRRMLADPRRGFGDAELQSLFATMRRAGRSIGPSYLDAAITVPKTQRRSLLKEAIRGRWSLKRLRQEVLSTTGKQFSFAGRRPHVPEDPAGVLLSLHGLCLGWQHWMAEIHRENGRDGKPRRAPIRELRACGTRIGDKSVVEVVEEVAGKLNELRKAIEGIKKLQRR